MSLPTIQGLTILSEIGRDAFSRRFRLMDPRPGILVLYSDPAAENHALRAWESLGDGSPTGGGNDVIARVERAVEFEGRRGLVLHADTGENPWTHAAYGELDAKPIIAAVASAVAALLRSDLGGHGALRRGAIELMFDGGVQVLPPFVSDAWLADQVGAPLLGGASLPAGYESLSTPGRDVADLAALISWLVGGVAITQVGSGFSVPAELSQSASPATQQQVRTLLELSATDPTAEEAAAALEKVGRGRRRSAAAALPATERAADSGARSTSNRSSERSEASERPTRVRRSSGSGLGTAAVGLLVLIAGVWMYDGGETIRRLIRSVGSESEEPLGQPTDPMKGAGSGVLAKAPESSADEIAADQDQESKIGGLTAEEAAQKILADMAAEREARNKPPVVPRPSYDRSKIEEGERLKKEGEALVAKVIKREIPFSKRNANLEQAIKLLEDARNKYLGFVEQYPDKERLVEGTVEDINAVLRLAYKSKTQ